MYKNNNDHHHDQDAIERKMNHIFFSPKNFFCHKFFSHQQKKFVLKKHTFENRLILNWMKFSPRKKKRKKMWRKRREGEKKEEEISWMKCEGRKIMCKSLSLFLSDGKKNNVKGERGEKSWNGSSSVFLLLIAIMIIILWCLLSFLSSLSSPSRFSSSSSCLEVKWTSKLVHSSSCCSSFFLSLPIIHSFSPFGRKNINVDVNTSSRDSFPFNS